MIETRKKRYQISLWVESRDDRSTPGLRLEFDSLDEAIAAFEQHRTTGIYKAGLMLDWNQKLNTWFLVDSYSLN